MRLCKYHVEGTSRAKRGPRGAMQVEGSCGTLNCISSLYRGDNNRPDPQSMPLCIYRGLTLLPGIPIGLGRTPSRFHVCKCKQMQLLLVLASLARSPGPTGAESQSCAFGIGAFTKGPACRHWSLINSALLAASLSDTVFCTAPAVSLRIFGLLLDVISPMLQDTHANPGVLYALKQRQHRDLGC